jgi:hypothetical protein
MIRNILCSKKVTALMVTSWNSVARPLRLACQRERWIEVRIAGIFSVPLYGVGCGIHKTDSRIVLRCFSLCVYCSIAF